MTIIIIIIVLYYVFILITCNNKLNFKIIFDDFLYIIIKLFSND
jgi:hypothetical protein